MTVQLSNFNEILMILGWFQCQRCSVPALMGGDAAEPNLIVSGALSLVISPASPGTRLGWQPFSVSLRLTTAKLDALLSRITAGTSQMDADYRCSFPTAECRVHLSPLSGMPESCFCYLPSTHVASPGICCSKANFFAQVKLTCSESSSAFTPQTYVWVCVWAFITRAPEA